MSSKYDSAQVLIVSNNNNSSHEVGDSSSSSYVLSRLAVARLLAFVEIDPITASRVALSVKKALVDSNELQISNRQLFQKVLEILVKNFEIRLPESDARLLAQYWRVRPLVVVVIKKKMMMMKKHQQQQQQTHHDESNDDSILLSVSQRLCDAAILDTNLLLQVDDIISGMFPKNNTDDETSSSKDVDEDLQYRRRSVTGSIAAESCRAFSRGGALVVGGPKEYFDDASVILNEMRIALKGSFGTASSSSAFVVHGCVLFAELDTVDENDEIEKSSIVKRSALPSPLSGNCLEVTIGDLIADHGNEQNHRHQYEETVAKTLVAHVRASLTETL